MNFLPQNGWKPKGFLPRERNACVAIIAQILKKIFRRYIQYKVSQKINITAKP